MLKKWFHIMVVLAMATTLLLLAAGSGAAGTASSETVRVFAAASTTHAVNQIGAIFTKRNRERFIPSFASSSTLAKQIDQGAPADIFISANVKWMDYLEQKQMIEKTTRMDLLSNRIVLIVPANSNVGQVRIAPGFNLLHIIGDSRIAMGDPDHVPAGIYAKQALKSLAVWAPIQKHVARCKDVRAALALVERGEASVGLVYATDAAISQKVKVAGAFSQTSHAPIIYPVAMVAGKRSPATERFMALLRSPEAKAVFSTFGFLVR